MNKQVSGVTNLLVVAAALSVGMLVGVTHAAEVPTKAVSYADLNLSSDAGVQVLYNRIHRAANEVCGNTEAHDLRGVRAHETCVQRAVSEAVASVNNSTAPVAVAQVR
jgi:UrcA family protein